LLEERQACAISDETECVYGIGAVRGGQISPAYEVTELTCDFRRTRERRSPSLDGRRNNREHLEANVWPGIQPVRHQNTNDLVDRSRRHVPQAHDAAEAFGDAGPKFWRHRGEQ
jgi:hypothetical protein